MPESKRPHLMGPSRLNHGAQQCVNCLATDREIAFALGPDCPEYKPPQALHLATSDGKHV